MYIYLYAIHKWISNQQRSINMDCLKSSEEFRHRLSLQAFSLHTYARKTWTKHDETPQVINTLTTSMYGQDKSEL